jgi:hypothetical protein
MIERRLDMDMTQPNAKRETAAADAPAMIPAVDVLENEAGSREGDLPASRRTPSRAASTGETLTIEGQASLGGTTRLEPVYAEVRTRQYSAASC